MRKKTVITLAVIIVVFLCVSAIGIYMYGPFETLGSFEKYDNDDVKYLRSAETLIKAGKFTYKYVDQSTVFIMPGLTLVLVPFVALFGQAGAVLPFKIFQALLSAISIVLVYLIGKKVGGRRRIGILSAGLSLFYIAEYFAMNVVLTEVIFRFLFLLLVNLLLVAFSSKRMLHYCLAGIVWSSMIMFRPTAGLIPFVVLVIWIIKKYTLKEMFKFGLAVSLIFLIVISPWWIRNYQTFGKFIPLTLSSGNPMLQGTYFNYENSEEENAIMESVSPFIYYGNDEITTDQIELDYAKLRVSTMFSHYPLKYTYWYTIGKTLHQWATPYVWASMFGLSYKSIFSAHLFYVFAFIVSVIAYILDKKRRNSAGAFLLLLVIYFNCIHLPYYAFSRYVYPVMPFMFVFISCFVNKIWNRFTYRNRSSVSKV